MPRATAPISQAEASRAMRVILRNITLTPHSSQGGVCAICGQAETTRTRGRKVSDLAVDHCHKTGRIRGLLCFKCNTALAQVEDRLASVTAYLTGSAAQ